MRAVQRSLRRLGKHPKHRAHCRNAHRAQATRSLKVRRGVGRLAPAIGIQGGAAALTPLRGPPSSAGRDFRSTH
eukprot:5872681-Pyramimonas_sp.AAC.1